MSLDTDEELIGFEWEAEKAYIVATSPQNKVSLSPNEDGDEFSWDLETVTVQEKPPARAHTQNTCSPTRQSDDSFTLDKTEGKQESNFSSNSQNSESAVNQKFTASNTQEQNTQLSIDSQEPVTDRNGRHQNRSGIPAASPTKLVHNPSAKTLVIFGPPGLGRGTLVQKLVYRYPQKFALTVSHTTRSPRLHETYARDFYFVSKNEMLKAINQRKFIEYVQVDGDKNKSQTERTYSSTVIASSSDELVTSSTSSSPSQKGHLYGTTWDAFYEAQFSGKPCIVLNITTKGAEQLKSAGIEGHYIYLDQTFSDKDVKFEPDKKIFLDCVEECYQELEEFTLSVINEVNSVTVDNDKEELQWERVPTIQLQAGAQQNSSPIVQARKRQLSLLLVSYSELLSHFQNADLSLQLRSIRPELQLTGLSRLLSPPKIAKKLRSERDRVFAIALCRFNDTNTLHTRALQTIYRRLTGEKTCQRFGSHWEDIGFQGSDPVDDLRGAGLLGLVQLVWLLEDPLTHSIAQEIFRSFKDNVPFCVLSINITGLVLSSLREGCLSRECNSREQVFAVINDYYAAVLVSFYNTWRQRRRGIMEIGVLLKEVGAFAKKHARYLIREYELNLKERQKKLSFSGGHGVLEVQPAVRFTPLSANVSRIT